MRILITCGPSFEPLDEVRRITNFSTGELGLLLTQQLVAAGHDVTCLRGVGATCPLAAPGATILPFSTNESLYRALLALAASAPFDAFFHTAALSDYRVESVRADDGEKLSARKLSSRRGRLLVALEPARKLISELRTLFPSARLVGWKYELNGGRADALLAGARQIRENLTDACVVNGAAFGEGFGFLLPSGNLVEAADKNALIAFLSQWLEDSNLALSGATHFPEFAPHVPPKT